eukprot:g20202.t1
MDFVSASQPRIPDTAACAFRTCCRFLNISMLSSAVRRQLPTASLDERDAFQFRYSLGVEARDLGVAEAARKWNVTYWKAWYWLGKLQGAHPGLHGGHRYQTPTPEAQIALEWSVFLLWEADPNLQDVEIVRILKNYDLYRRRNCRSARGTRVVLGRDMSEHVDVTYSVTYLTSLVHPRGHSGCHSERTLRLSWRDFGRGDLGKAFVLAFR